MTPTKAQIEAAARAIMKTTYPSAEAQAKAALTAAAEAGEQESGLDYMLRHSNAAVNATIERCALVAESTTYMSGAHIAAAIRALKDS